MQQNEDIYWFVFCKDELLLERTEEDHYTIPLQQDCPVKLQPWNAIHNITPTSDSIQCKTVRIDAPITEDQRYRMCGLRASFNYIPHELYIKAGKCAEILYWDQNTKFCGVCGGPMKLHTDISKRCENCGKEVWPQLATAVIVLIHRDDKVLLVHANNFHGNFFGLVAGFVETGETLEECVQREVREETNLHIRNIKYFASQPWPYPCGLMVGFNADYESGEITLQRSELGAGGWYTRQNLPEIPGKMSMARMLLDNWLKEAKE